MGLVLIGIALMQYSIYANAHSLDRSDMCKHGKYLLIAPALNAVSEAGVEVSNTGELSAFHFRGPCQSCNDEAWEYRPIFALRGVCLSSVKATISTELLPCIK